MARCAECGAALAKQKRKGVSAVRGCAAHPLAGVDWQSTAPGLVWPADSVVAHVGAAPASTTTEEP